MKKIIVLFFLIMFVIGTDTFLISPLIPTLQNSFHISTEYSGWMVGAYALGYAVFALIAGPLSDGWDRKKVNVFRHGLLLGFNNLMRFCHRFLVDVFIPFFSRSQRSIYSTSSLGIHSCFVSYAQDRQSIRNRNGRRGCFSSIRRTYWKLTCCNPLVLSVFYSRCVLVAGGDIYPLCFTRNKTKSSFQRVKIPIFKRYIPLLTSRTARISFLAYFLFHSGFFAAFSFIGKWVDDRFSPFDRSCGVRDVFLGVGNIVGSISGAYVIKMWNRFNTMVVGFLASIALFISLPHLPSVSGFEGAYFIIFVNMGITFPLMLGLLTSLNPTIRGTVPSLANSIMYAATALGSWIAGLIYATFNGFSAVGIFAATCFAGSLLSFILSGILTIESKAQKGTCIINA